MIILGNPLVVLGEHVASKRCLLLEPSRTWIQKVNFTTLWNSTNPAFKPFLQFFWSIYLNYLLGITRIEAWLYIYIVFLYRQTRKIQLHLREPSLCSLSRAKQEINPPLSAMWEPGRNSNAHFLEIIWKCDRNHWTSWGLPVCFSSSMAPKTSVKYRKSLSSFKQFHHVWFVWSWYVMNCHDMGMGQYL